jgi:hypothetical protein
MGLLKKLFGGRSPSEAGGSVQFEESDNKVEGNGSGNAPRRELVHVVLRDTMRRHAIPSDWIDCRILSVVTRQNRTGMHVQFIVRQGEDRLLEYVHPFQDTFWKELEKFESRPREWLFSLTWQFDGDHGADDGAPLAAAEGWSDDTQPPEEDTHPSEIGPEAAADHAADHHEELQSDLKALFAIRDAAISDPTPLAKDGDKPPGARGS